MDDYFYVNCYHDEPCMPSINPLPLKYVFLRIHTPFKNYELFKAFFSLIKFLLDSLHAKYTDE